MLQEKTAANPLDDDLIGVRRNTRDAHFYLHNKVPAGAASTKLKPNAAQSYNHTRRHSEVFSEGDLSVDSQG